jgi:phosphoribosyl-ATP pyrophosphohydrolase/phosphoribosyl-AMP cyclohydrolase
MENRINFSKLDGLVPCIIQDFNSKTVLMLGFMNAEAYQKTIAEKLVTFYSRNKGALWTKGETSGNFLEVIEVWEDCDNDTLLLKVIPKGPVCHSGADTCFNEKNEQWSLRSLENVIANRQTNSLKGSYTSNLFESGINKIAQKVGEEAVELIIEAKDNNNDLFLSEGADLLFHFLVLLRAKGFSLSEVVNVLKERGIK